MKFRYKVLMINLILLSVSLGAVGYLMIRKNFTLAQQTQLQNAIVQNNLVQSSVEYELLQLLNSSSGGIKARLPEIGERVTSSMRSTDSSFYIRYGNDYVYSSDGEQQTVEETLFEDLQTGGKNYVITCEEGVHYIYVTSFSQVQGKDLCIISKCDVSEAYNLRETQVGYFRWVLIGVLLAGSAIMYVVSMYLTRPLEQLNRVSEEIARGDYDTRVEVHTGDEIGLLADKFNLMAGAVAEHVEELNDMIRRRDQFVADFTHEIKTPMTTIIGYADTMRSMELPREEQIMALSYIFSEGRRLETMSGKLFELIYLKQHDIEKTNIHVGDMCREIVKIVRPAMERKHMTITSSIEPAVLSGNRELLVTAFVNLLDNARKASTEGMSVELEGRILDAQFPDARTGGTEEMTQTASAGEKTSYYELSVIDHGVGMTEEETARICDEFYMVDKSRSRKEGGAGIGMSLVALILEHHGAQLHIESKPGEGTRMRVCFMGWETVCSGNESDPGRGYFMDREEERR